MALSLVHGVVGASAAHGVGAPHSGSSVHLMQAATQHAGSTVRVPGFSTKVGYLKKDSTSWHRSGNDINRSCTVLRIRACQGELLSLARGIAPSPVEDLSAPAHHGLPNLATTLVGDSKENVDVEIAGGGRPVTSSSRSCARSAAEKRRVICISGPTA